MNQNTDEIIKLLEAGWRIVVFAAECDQDGNCPICLDIDFSDCDCPGPTQDEEYDYVICGNTLLARRI